jgi:hypothetical protein
MASSGTMSNARDVEGFAVDLEAGRAAQVRHLWWFATALAIAVVVVVASWAVTGSPLSWLTHDAFGPGGAVHMVVTM